MTGNEKGRISVMTRYDMAHSIYCLEWICVATFVNVSISIILHNYIIVELAK